MSTIGKPSEFADVLPKFDINPKLASLWHFRDIDESKDLSIGADYYTLKLEDQWVIRRGIYESERVNASIEKAGDPAHHGLARKGNSFGWMEHARPCGRWFNDDGTFVDQCVALIHNETPGYNRIGLEMPDDGILRFNYGPDKYDQEHVYNWSDLERAVQLNEAEHEYFRFKVRRDDTPAGEVLIIEPDCEYNERVEGLHYTFYDEWDLSKHRVFYENKFGVKVGIECKSKTWAEQHVFYVNGTACYAALDLNLDKQIAQFDAPLDMEDRNLIQYNHLARPYPFKTINDSFDKWVSEGCRLDKKEDAPDKPEETTIPMARKEYHEFCDMVAKNKIEFDKVRDAENRFRNDLEDAKREFSEKVEEKDRQLEEKQRELEEATKDRALALEDAEQAVRQKEAELEKLAEELNRAKSLGEETEAIRDQFKKKARELEEKNEIVDRRFKLYLDRCAYQLGDEVVIRRLRTVGCITHIDLGPEQPIYYVLVGMGSQGSNAYNESELEPIQWHDAGMELEELSDKQAKKIKKEKEKLRKKQEKMNAKLNKEPRAPLWRKLFFLD